DDLPDRLIIAHLGNGASVTAVKAGKSIDTSMGLTPSGGVIMGTRSGDLDPGVLIYLMREKQLNAAMLEELIDRRSGLLGVSGTDGDMRRLQEAASSNTDARLAIQMFCYSVRKQVAAMIAALDGVDAIVFTGGIGENDAEVRAAICRGLSWLGVSLDEARNVSPNKLVSCPASRCSFSHRGRTSRSRGIFGPCCQRACPDRPLRTCSAFFVIVVTLCDERSRSSP